MSNAKFMSVVMHFIWKVISGPFCSLIIDHFSMLMSDCLLLRQSEECLNVSHACETKSPTVQSCPCSPHFIWCDLSGLGSESYTTMQLTSASGNRGNGERGYFKVLQRLSGILRIAKQPRSTVKVSPYPNRCDTTPLVPCARVLMPLVYASTPLNLQPHLPPIASPNRKELLLPKSCCPQHSCGTSVCLSHQHTRLLTHCFAHTHSCMGSMGGHIFLLSKLILLCFIPFPLSHTPFGQWAYCLWQLSIHAEPLPKLSEHCLDLILNVVWCIFEQLYCKLNNQKPIKWECLGVYKK